MKIADIRIGERHRRDMGDIAALAESIKTEGLLQPIGVTPENELVFGHRRLLACRDHLGWGEIDHRVVQVSSIAAGEYAENEMRKQFTMSEQVAIMRTIETIGSAYDFSGEKPAPLTRGQAAIRAGFDSRVQSWRAERLVDDAPDLAEKVDKGEMSIYGAFSQAEKAGRIERKRTPGGNVKGRPKKGAASSPKPRRIEPPTLRLTNLPTSQELGTPPPDAPWAEREAWREEMGAKVVLYLPQIRRLMNDKLVVENLGNVIRQLARRDDLPNLQQLGESLARLAAHQHNPNAARPEEQVDYAKAGREAQRQIVESLDAAIAKLEAYRAMVPRRAVQEAEEQEHARQ